MGEELQKLHDKVQAAEGAADSAATLIGGLAQRIRDLAQNATDLADLKTQISAEADDLDTHTAALSAAVAANTAA